MTACSFCDQATSDDGLCTCPQFTELVDALRPPDLPLAPPPPPPGWRSKAEQKRAHYKVRYWLAHTCCGAPALAETYLAWTGPKGYPKPLPRRSSSNGNGSFERSLAYASPRVSLPTAWYVRRLRPGAGTLHSLSPTATRRPHR